MSFTPPKGTRDFLPDETYVRRWMFDVARAVFEKYGFGEVDTPAFESLELLEAKGALGEEAVKDIYRFEDKAKRRLGLRFDPTTPIARIVASRKDLTMPLLWCYNFVKMWRYEDVSKGRYREFSQSGVEVVGSKSVEADALVLKVVIDYLLALGINQFVIRINSRKILDMLADRLKIRDRDDIFRIIDKLDKQGDSAVRKELMEKGLAHDSIDAIMNFVNMSLDEVKNYFNVSSLDVDEIISCLLGNYRRFVRFDASIARGLDYYTGFIFETTVNGYESLGSVASGGRYDSLIEKYGGQPTPATGVGIGVERLVEIVKERGLCPKRKTLIYIAQVSDSIRQKATEMADELRENGFVCETDIMSRSLGAQMKYASSRGADFVIIIGEKDLAKKQVTLRNMQTGEEFKADTETLVDVLKKE